MKQPELLYQELMVLVETNDAFFFKDFPADDPERMYRIFNYRLASYSDFCLPSALEARGIMFLVSRAGEFEDLVCRPPKKFFNLGENPMTLGLDLSNLFMVMKKEDGSLMSSYIHTTGELRLKSKGSTGSEQANDAMAFLKTQPGLLSDLKFLAARDFTVNMEWTAPWNRIVIGYQKPALVVLSIIDNQTGSVFFRDFAEDLMLTAVINCWVDDFEYDGTLEDTIQNMVGEEGIVGITSNGVHFKMKCPWYLNLHRNKDSVSNTKSLIDLILSEQIDDLKTLFVGDQVVLDKIYAYEHHISNVYNTVVRDVESFHKLNSELDMRQYAINAMGVWNDHWGFHAQMSIARGKNYCAQIKEMMMRNYKSYILKEFERVSEES